MDNIKTAPKEKFTHTPTQLKNLVEAAQKGDREAIGRLCHDFAPLIYKEARRSNVQGALGEDAVNTAWVIFLEFIQRYKGSNYRLLPGLVQKHVHYGLLHHAGKSNQSNTETSLEAALPSLIYSPMEAVNAKLSLKQTLLQLSEKEKLVLYYKEKLPPKAIAAKLGCTERSVYRHYAKAVTKINKQLVIN